jgi:hypothetical protein
MSRRIWPRNSVHCGVSQQSSDAPDSSVDCFLSCLAHLRRWPFAIGTVGAERMVLLEVVHESIRSDATAIQMKLMKVAPMKTGSAKNFNIV